MRNSNRLLLLFILSITSALSSQLFAEEVSKDIWNDRMTTVLPAFFCKSSSYFRQCFSVSAQECEETAASVSRICLANLSGKIPNSLTLPEEGQYWGTKIGECAGNAYEVVLMEHLIHSSECQDISNWQ